MKKLILLASGCAVLAAGVWAASLFAQGTGAPATATAAPAQKIGVVNVGYVFNNWEKAKQFKAELEAAAEPYNKQAKKLQEEIATWEGEVRTGKYDKQNVEMRQNAVTKNKRLLEDLALDMRKSLGKRSEDNLVMLWKEANECVKVLGKQQGFSLVFGYGDPLDKALMELFPNVNRKMNAMDGGASVLLYMHESADLSTYATQVLNHWHKLRQDQIQGTPTSGGPAKK